MVVFDRRVTGIEPRLTFQRAEVAVQVAASALVDELVTARPARHDVVVRGIVSAVTVGDECVGQRLKEPDRLVGAGCRA
jgi:hypothetical protein